MNAVFGTVNSKVEPGKKIRDRNIQLNSQSTLLNWRFSFIKMNYRKIVARDTTVNDEK